MPQLLNKSLLKTGNAGFLQNQRKTWSYDCGILQMGVNVAVLPSIQNVVIDNVGNHRNFGCG